MIEVNGLVKKYGSHTAVDHLNFRIEKGHIYGLLGPNGAGKSTTMNIMTGYLGATEGEVLINGHDILKEPELAKKSVGYLPEMPPLYMDMKVQEYLMFAAELKKVKKTDRKAEVKKIMKMVRIYDVRERLIKNLSKGYRQRVGLAQAVLGFPETIILDEPTVGLDPKQIIEIRELIRELAKDHTVILSSHILAEIREVCDYIIIISQGKLVASDTPENLEKKFSGNAPTEIETRLLPEKIEEILSRIPGIQKVSYLSSDPGITRAVIETKEDVDIREEIFRAFAREDSALISMYRKQNTLEDIFLQLTQEGGRPHAGNL
ncbi:ABC transporter [Drancourtella sp. An12]|uniref:ABC transporter ATP-binding protein n=1 Tax=Drancourtella sp. An12 TaxID=1965548 RepID=UPI000B38EC21|nr:ABC transporter ATP-binding protein [Drancourtella sp. An12]OUQ47100.1 ABC transporter [Drancourtella sp. An12]